MTVSQYHIAGMDCAAEEQLVRIALSELDGIDHLEFDLEDRTLSVEHHLDTTSLTAALRPLGLRAEHIGDTNDALNTTGSRSERPALVFALVINAGFFIGELTVGIISQSMGLIADALDMGADASVYALSLAAVGTAAARKQQLARVSGYLQLALASIGLIEVVRRFVGNDELPDPTSMIVMSALALAGNIAVLVMLHRFRRGEAHLQASWIFTANDVKVNGLVIVAAIGVIIFNSAIPDLIAGTFIFLVVANGARRILGLTR